MGERTIEHNFRRIDVLVVGLHLRWNGVWQRPNHVLARIARDVPVIVLEEPAIDGGSGHTVDRMTLGVTVLTPHRAAATDHLDAEAIAAVRAAVGERRPLIWLYAPMMAALADAFPGAPVVFDKMDELAAFADADPRLPAREAAILARSDVAFAGGRSLHARIDGRTARAICYPSGVDVEHFARARKVAAHPDLPREGGRIFGYVGVIDERLDLALIAALADAFPNDTIAMVGPIVKIDPASVPRRTNIAYLGKRSYEELPELLAGFDVALMPFAINEHTANISPTKTLEYLAAGRPVVSTPIVDVVADHADVVAIAADAPGFIAAVRAAMPPQGETAKRIDAKVRAATWDAIAAAMRDDLRAAGIVYETAARDITSAARS